MLSVEEGNALARIERGLRRDDPCFAARLAAVRAIEVWRRRRWLRILVLIEVGCVVPTVVGALAGIPALALAGATTVICLPLVVLSFVPPASPPPEGGARGSAPNGPLVPWLW